MKELFGFASLIMTFIMLGILDFQPSNHNALIASGFLAVVYAIYGLKE